MMSPSHRAQPNYIRTEDATLDPVARRLMADPVASHAGRDTCMRCQGYDARAVKECNQALCSFWLNRAD